MHTDHSPVHCWCVHHISWLGMVQDMDASFPPSGNALPMSAATAPPPTRSPPPPDLTATSANDHAAVHTPSLENRHEDNNNKERVVHEGDERERQNRELRAGLHPLQHRFVFWYTQRTPGIRSRTSYEDNMKKIADFSTVGCFSIWLRSKKVIVHTPNRWRVTPGVASVMSPLQETDFL
jgi:hypothetical protein